MAAKCGRCNGIGVFYDPQVQQGRYGQVRLCACVQQHCQCRGEPPYQFWGADSRREWCPCRRYRQRLTQTGVLFRQAEVPERYRWRFLDDFHRVAPDGAAIAHADRVLVEAAGLVGEARCPVRGVLLHGPPGTGKTLLGCIMLNELLLRWCRAGRFLNLSRRYFERLRDTYSQDSAHYGQTWPIIEELTQLPFLLLDDFGTQRGTEWEMEMLYNLVDARYAEQRLTLVTTNQPLDAIRELYGGRIYSRLVEMCRLVEMQGIDYRQHLTP